MSSELVSFCERLLAAGFCGLYQGLLLALVAGVGLRLLPRTNAATRHALWLILLLLLGLVIPAHYWMDRPSPSIAGNRAAPAYPPFDRDPVSEAAGPSEPRTVSESGLGDNITSQEVAVEAGPGQVEASCATGAEDSDRESASAALGPGPQTDQPGPRVVWPATFQLGLPGWMSVGLVMAWLGMAGVRGGLLLGRLCQVRRLKQESWPAEEGLVALFAGLCRDLGVRRRIELRFSAKQGTPVLLGFFHPVILLPAPADGPFERAEIEPILRHELAHAGRWDDWSNLFQHCLQALLCFHPAAWWIGRRLSLEREIACDDWVLAQGNRPQAYALLLATLAGRRNGPALAPGVTTNKHELRERIDMILNTRRNRSPGLAKSRLGLFTTAAAMTALLVVGAAPRLVLAQTPVPPRDASPPAVAPEAAQPAPDQNQAPGAGQLRPPGVVPRPGGLIPGNRGALQPGWAPGMGGTPQFRGPEGVQVNQAIEERLARLERKVEQLLLAQQNQRRVRGVEEPRRAAELERRAAELGQRGAEGADPVRRPEKEQAMRREATQRQIERLHAAREDLRRQLERLDREVEQLERNQERIRREATPNPGVERPEPKKADAN